MPRLPEVDEIQRVQVRPSTNVAQSDTSSVGDAISQFGSVVSKLAEHEMTRVNHTVVREAQTELQQKSAELTYGKTGFQNVKGSRAVLPQEGEAPFTQQYTEQFKSMQEGVMARLSPAQRDMLAPHADAERMNFQSALLRHQVSEGEKFHKEARAGGLMYSAQTAQVQPYNAEGNAIRTKAINDAMAIFNDDVTIHGEARDAAEAARAAWLNDTHIQTLQNLMSTDPENAKKYFEEHKKEILDLEVGAKVGENATQNKASVIGDAVARAMLAATPGEISREVLYAAISQSLPEGTTAVDVAHARKAGEEQMLARTDALVKLRAAPLQMVLDGASLPKMKASPAYQALDSHGRLYIESEISRRDRGLESEDSFAQLKAKLALTNDPKFIKMSNDEVLDFAQKNKLSAASALQLVGVRNDMNNPKEQQAGVDTSMFNDLYLLNKMPGGLEKKESNEAYLRTLNKVEEEIIKAQRGGVNLTRERKKEIAQQQMELIQVQKPRWFIPDTTVGIPRALLTKEDKLAYPAFTPAQLESTLAMASVKEREAVVHALGAIKPGVEPTQKEIATALARAKWRKSQGF